MDCSTLWSIISVLCGATQEKITTKPHNFYKTQLTWSLFLVIMPIVLKQVSFLYHRFCFLD